MDVMNMPRTKLGHINTHNLLVIGFDDIHFKQLSKYKNGSTNYRLERSSSVFQAYHWLISEINNRLPDKHPRGILCDWEFLVKDDFRFLKKVQAHPILKYLPFIVVSANAEDIDAKEVLQRGIDDCYSMTNMRWNDLKRRVEFLHRFKSEIINTNVETEFKEYKTAFAKRTFDLVFAVGVLLAISPVLILVAIAVKLESKGPIFYTSKRAGTGFQIFDFIKFRSMCQDADQKLKDLQHLNQYDENEENSTFVKLQNDPRVTRVGKFIRKTSIDELPQLLNVLKGDMSIVGNRPLPLYEAEQLTNDAWAKRFSAPAGLTGLWQVSKRGKGDMSTDERIQLDIDYADQFSFWMDIKIILRTLPAMIQEEQV